MMGEKYTVILLVPRRADNGTEMPLIKMSGKRTRLDSIMIFEELVDAGDAYSTPSEEKQNAPTTVLTSKSETVERLIL